MRWSENYHFFQRSIDPTWGTGSFAENNTLSQLKDDVINYILNWKPNCINNSDLNGPMLSDTTSCQISNQPKIPSFDEPTTYPSEGSSGDKRALNFDNWAKTTSINLDNCSHRPNEVEISFKAIEDLPLSQPTFTQKKKTQYRNQPYPYPKYIPETKQDYDLPIEKGSHPLRIGAERYMFENVQIGSSPGSPE